MQFALRGAVAALALAGCAPAPAPASVHKSMAETVAPQAQVLWDISNRAQNDNGDPDASKLSADDWTKLVAASGQLSQAGLALSKLEKPVAVAEGEKIADEGQSGASTGAQVQGFIDADRDGFRTHAKALEAIGADFLTASNANDATKLMDASGRMDQVCEACHLKFWYPQQAAQK